MGDHGDIFLSCMASPHFFVFCVEYVTCLAVGFPRADPHTGIPYFVWEVVPGKSAHGLGKPDREGKEATAGYVHKQVTSVGNRASAPLGTSGDPVEWAPSHHPEGAGELGIYTPASLHRWLEAASGGLAPGHFWPVWHPGPRGRGTPSGRDFRAFGSCWSYNVAHGAPLPRDFVSTSRPSSCVSPAVTFLQQLLVLPPLVSRSRQVDLAGDLCFRACCHPSSLFCVGPVSCSLLYPRGLAWGRCRGCCLVMMSEG